MNVVRRRLLVVLDPLPIVPAVVSTVVCLDGTPVDDRERECEGEAMLMDWDGESGADGWGWDCDWGGSYGVEYENDRS